MDELKKRLMNSEIKKKNQEISDNIQAIQNSELQPSRCKCGNLLWEQRMFLFEIPALHPMNGTGRKLNRAFNALFCSSCHKVHPDHTVETDEAYIPNIPSELRYE